MKKYSKKTVVFSIIAGIFLIIILLNLVKANVFYNLVFIPDIFAYLLFSTIVFLSVIFGPITGLITVFLGILLGFLIDYSQWNLLYLFFGLIYSIFFAIYASCIGLIKIIIEKKCKQTILFFTFIGLSIFIASFIFCNILDQVGFEFYFEYSFNFDLGFGMFGIAFEPIEIIGKIFNDTISKFSLRYWFHALIITLLSIGLFLLFEKIILKFIIKKLNKKDKTDDGNL